MGCPFLYWQRSGCLSASLARLAVRKHGDESRVDNEAVGVSFADDVTKTIHHYNFDKKESKI
jgi:hypothetical protein